MVVFKTFLYILSGLAVVIFTTIWPLVSFAQNPEYTKINDMLPPSPHAASLGKYGGITVGLSSGTQNISVPLYDYKVGNLNLPISLSYSSNGFKVDEVASRVGLSWSINGGGVITRAIMGQVDEKRMRVTPPANFPQRTQELLDFAADVDNQDSEDGEIDIFSFNFNGFTGQFLLDNNLNPVLLTHSGLKIEKDLSSTAVWNFKIITPNGVQYFFGGQSATEFNTNISTCGKAGTPLGGPTAWYLTKIVDSNNQTINLTYLPKGFNFTSGVNESMFSGLISFSVPPGGQSNAPTLDNRLCISLHHTSTVYLSEISSTTGGKIVFSYDNNRKDVADNLLKRIEIYQPGQVSYLKSFDFLYQQVKAQNFLNTFSVEDTTLLYRPFLVSIKEGGAQQATFKTHRFSYNQLSSLPPRLSYAQDSYGYFNGKVNSTLIPVPTSLTWANSLPNATADRSSDAAYATMGVLSKITYPTGGSDSLVYEGNTSYQQVPYNVIKTVSISGVGIGQMTPKTVSSAIFTMASTKYGNISARCIYEAGSYEPDLHNICTFIIHDVTSNTDVFSENIALDQSINRPDGVQLQSGHSYQLIINPRGVITRGTFLVDYPDDNPPPVQYANLPVSGLRIGKLITNSSNINAAVEVKRFFYYNLSNPQLSTGQFLYAAHYDKFQRVYVPTYIYSDSHQGMERLCPDSEYDYYSMYSNSQTNIYAHPSSPIFYSSVVESFGDNFDNGGIEHHFQLAPDIPGNTILGDPISSAPLSSFNWKNDKEVYTYSFKTVNNLKVPVKKIFTTFREDPRINQEFVSYVVNKKYSSCAVYTVPTEQEFNSYDLATYSHFRKWLYTDSVIAWTYDALGQNYTQELQVYEYANPVHALLTKTTSTTSNGSENKVVNVYPGDLVLSGDEETGRLALLAENVIDAPIKQQTYKNNVKISENTIKYHVFDNGLPQPNSYNVQIGSNPGEDRVSFYGYNNYGKLLSQSIKNGPITSYQWDNQSQYIVAMCKNAQNKDFYYDGFEEGTGNSSLNACRTGHFSHNGSYSKSLTGLTAGSYKLSFWTNVPSGWFLTTTSINVPGGTYTINLTGQIDDVRFYPAEAEMTTYRYDPLIGMSSETDAKGETIYYEYNEFQQLTFVRDAKGNIIKSFKYSYKQ